MKPPLQFLLFAILACSYITACRNDDNRDVNPENPQVRESVISRLEPGDIIVKKGRGRLSQRIADQLNEKVPLSHCGIVASRGDSLYFIHSVAKELTGIDGVQEVGIETFMKDVIRGTFYAVRLRDTGNASARLEAAAKRFAARGVSFDYQLNNEDSTQMNCSEFVYWTLRSGTGKDYFKRIPVQDSEALAFNSLLDTTHFEIVSRY